MCGDLKNAVRRRVHDERTRFYALFAVVLDDFRARIGLVAKHFSARASFKLFDDVLRETVRVGRQRLWRDYARNLPVSYCSVLAQRRFFKARIASLRIRDSAAHRIDIEKSELDEIGAIEMLVITDCAERVAAFVVP